MGEEDARAPSASGTITAWHFRPVVRHGAFSLVGKMNRRIEDESFMRRALRLAERGRGHVAPNPAVGAVVTRGGRIVGEGWHRQLGGPHAECMALTAAGARARGATLYVTLEPCAHFGRTPPCTDKILAAGIRRCVVAVKDPHPIVNGRGLRVLRKAGLRVEVGTLAEGARAALGGYWLSHTRRRPRVTLKLAASLDGRIAPFGGFAQGGRGRWLTGAAARARAHRLRAESDALVIGAGTARADDPRLTARGIRGARQPLRVLCDTRLGLPRTLRLLRAPLAKGTVIACGPRAPRAVERDLVLRGVTVWRLPAGPDGVSLPALARRLAREGRHEVLVEGGARLATAWLQAGLVDRLALFTAPRVLGERGLEWCGPLRRPLEGRVAEQGRAGEDLWCLIDMEPR
jgi:diaminohydroxyphosphoribosylaminopyrimidine deaminase / 5-amino-6-(5-phosphoribosylamino)uracil reductase